MIGKESFGLRIISAGSKKTMSPDRGTALNGSAWHKTSGGATKKPLWLTATTE
jgi:hypothetical protein